MKGRFFNACVLFSCVIVRDSYAVAPVKSPTLAPAQGRSIRQSFSEAEIAPEMLNTLAAGPGSVSASAVHSAMYQMGDVKERQQKGILLLASSSANISLGESNNAGPPPTLYKFDYQLGYEGTKFARFTEQSIFIRVEANQRKVLFVRNRNLPDGPPREKNPEIKPDAAQQAALSDAKEASGHDELQADTEIEPVQKEYFVGVEGESKLAWKIVIRLKPESKKRLFARRYWIAAANGAILYKEDIIQYADAKATGDYWEFKKSSLTTATRAPLPMLVVGKHGMQDVVTNDNGIFTNSADIQFSSALRGPYCRIVNDGAPTGAVTAQSDGDERVYPSNHEFATAQLSAFRWIVRARTFVNDFLPGSPTILNEVRVHVNVDDRCNANWDQLTRSFNFFRSDAPGCVNTAYSDIVFHEYGHAVDHQLGGIMDSAYSEGFGDSLALLITRDSIVGRDFFGSGNDLRDNKEVVKWPAVKNDSDPHRVGQAYASFVWDLTQRLKTKFSGNEDQAFEAARKLVLRAAVLNPKDIPDAVLQTFIADHEGGGKFFSELKGAAESRSLPRPSTPSELDSAPALSAVTASTADK